MQIKEYICLKEYTTIRLGGSARYFGVCKNESDILDCANFAENKKVSILVLGGGSNLVIGDIISDIFCIKMENKGIEILDENDLCVRIKVCGGEIWDDFVDFVVKSDFSGVENLSSIPGTVGASPVQNIGAYGQEVSNVIESVKGYNIITKKFETISAENCRFGYRDSIFKNRLKGKFIIESVVFKFKKEIPQISKYPKVSETLNDIKTEFPNMSLLKQIRKTIQKIRLEKLPDPKLIPNAGSFFKNVFVDEPKLKELQKIFSGIPFFQYQNGYKIPSGWLIEKSGLKGVEKNGIGTYYKNALVVVNKSAQNIATLMSFVSEIQKAVKDKFSLNLEIEPEIILC